MANAQFADLSSCEREVVRAAAEGTFANCSIYHSIIESGSGPEKCARWGKESEVRASLIRWLALDRDASRLVDPKGIRLQAARVTASLDLSFSKINFPLAITDSCIPETLQLGFAEISELHLAGSRTGAIEADRLIVHGDVNLRRNFVAAGEVRFPGAKILGNIDLSGAKLSASGAAALVLDGAHVDGDLLMLDGFHADGEVRIGAIHIGGALIAAGAAIHNPNATALGANGASVGGSVFLSDGFKSIGAINLVAAEIGGDLDLEGTSFDCASPRPQETPTHPRASLPCALVAERAMVRGRLFLRKLKLDSATQLDLTYTTSGPFFDDKASWPSPGNLALDGFSYDSFGSGPRDATSRLEWLALQSSPAQPRFIPQPFNRLAKVLRDAGDEAGARRVLMALEDARRTASNQGVMLLVWSWVLKTTIGYGHEPQRAFYWGIAIVAIGTLLFRKGYNAGLMTPSEMLAYRVFAEGGKPPPFYPRFSAVIFSLDTFLPVIELHQARAWMPNPNRAQTPGAWYPRLLQMWTWAEIIMGWILTTLFVAGLSGIVRGA